VAPGKGCWDDGYNRTPTPVRSRGVPNVDSARAGGVVALIIKENTRWGAKVRVRKEAGSKTKLE